MELAGFHAHIGSQIFDLTSYEVAAGILGRFMVEVRRETGFIAKVLNLGGGLGIRYTREDKPLPVREAAKRTGQMVGRSLPLLITPGRNWFWSRAVRLW